MSSYSQISATRKVQPVVLNAELPNHRGLVSPDAGTVSGTTKSGSAVTGYPVFAGYNPIEFDVITASTVTGLWIYF